MGWTVKLSANPYGPGQSIKGRQGFVAIAIGKILAGEKIAIRGDGSIIRDFIYIEDVSEALHLAATCQAQESIFNVGSGQGRSLNQVIAIIREITREPVDTTYIDSRFVDIPESVLDISREKNVLGKVSKVPLEQGLARTLAFHGIEVAQKV